MEAKKNPIIQLFGGMEGFIRYHEQEILLKIDNLSHESSMLKMQYGKKKDKPERG
jgi:hypothetical protein